MTHILKHFIPCMILFLCLAFPAIAQTGSPAQEPEHVRVIAVPEHQTVKGGERLWVAIVQNIEPGWHTYWINPGDSGVAPVVTWTGPTNVRASDVIWPAPHRIPYEILMNFGYEGRVTSLHALDLPPDLPEGPVTFQASAEILVCKDICIPEQKSLSFTVNTGDGVDDTQTFAAARSMMPLPLEGQGTFGIDGNDFIIRLPRTALPDDALSEIALFPAEWGLLRNAAATRIEKPDDTTVVLRHERDVRDPSEITALPVLLAYNASNGQYASASITLMPDPALKATAAGEAAPGASPQAPAQKTPDLSLIGAILFALAGGVILNLMPCVFPVLSIKALKLIDLQSQGRGAAAKSGMAYTAGILASFAAIGGLLLAAKAGGAGVGWGFQLQNPLVILGLAYLLFVIGLNLAGVFEITGTLANAGSALTRKNGLTGTFFTGVLATLVATPCTAPFMAGALGYALFQPIPVAMAVFMALGFGLALPYLLLCLVPGLSRVLPRPGIWMVRFKECLAFPMFASAAWLVWVLSMQAGSDGVLWALGGMIGLAFAFWAVSHRPEKAVLKALVLVCMIAGLGFAALPFIRPGILQTAGQDSAVHTGTSHAEAFSKATLDKALGTGRPVFAYMTAAWCITCKVNEKVALQNAQTQAHFEKTGTIVLEGDWTNRNPEITSFLAGYGRSGVPLYVYYGPADPATGQRPEPVVLPQVLTPGLVREKTAGTP